MMRNAGHVCPVAGCGNMRLRQHAVCRSCWGRLPADLTARISAAKRDGARHLEAKAAMEATAWLSARAPQRAIARVCGESDR